MTSRGNLERLERCANLKKFNKAKYKGYELGKFQALIKIG